MLFEIPKAAAIRACVRRLRRSSTTATALLGSIARGESDIALTRSYGQSAPASSPAARSALLERLPLAKLGAAGLQKPVGDPHAFHGLVLVARPASRSSSIVRRSVAMPIPVLPDRSGLHEK